MKKVLLIFAVMIVFASADVFAVSPDSITGDWYTAEGNSIVQVYKCGDLFCGKITWLKNPKTEDGKDKVDSKNPDEAKKNRKLLGLDILSGFKYSGGNIWQDGTIYDPKNGKTYSCKMTLEGNELKVRGYIGFSLLGRTTVWTRKI
jgi:uncharacterized protein (DUF2147 family)